MRSAVWSRSLPAVSLVSLLAWPLLLAAAPAQTYYPSLPGTRWTYSNGETQIVGAPALYKGVRVVPISHQFGSTTYTQDLLEFRADGSVWLRGVNAGGRVNWYAPPLNVYPPAPLAPGRSWSSSARVGTSTLSSVSTVTGIEPLKTALGSFNALVIRTVLTSGGRQSTQITHFVPTVGVVRYQTADGTQISLLK